MASPEALSLAPLWYVAFLLSITCHEAAHAVAARWGGDPTAFDEGQATLNPWPHVRREPIGTVLVPLISFAFVGWMIGWASAPYDRDWQRRHPHRAGLMALAGPVANLLLALLAGLAIHAGLATGHFAMPESARFTQVVAAATPGAEGAAVLLSILFSLNLLLAFFNLIPFPPLDGSAVAGLLLPADIARRYAAFLEGSPLAFLGIVLAWRVFDRIAGPLFGLGLSLLYPGASWR